MNYPANVQWALRLEGVQSELTSRVRPLLGVLMGAVGLLLAIACVNIANLTLARASSRVREIAVRRALGATRGQLVRQLLVESLVVAVAGGVGALAALAWSRDWIVAMLPADLPRLPEVQLRRRHGRDRPRAVDGGGRRVRHRAGGAGLGRRIPATT